MKKIVKPNLLVLSGVILTIFSAVINHFQIAKHNGLINNYKIHSLRVEKNIDNVWRSVQKIENKVTYASMLITINNIDNDLYQEFLKDILQEFNINNNEISTTNKLDMFKQFKQIFDNFKNKKISYINDIYEQKVTNTEKINSLELKNSKLSNLALFLQVIGLILVLSRDLFAKK